MKNLVYYSVGYNENYNKMLEISLFSLKTHYDGDILIITDYENSNKLKNIEIFKDVNFMIVKNENDFDTIINRLKIFEYYKILEYDNALYLDCDSIIIHNLDSIFNKASKYNKFGICEDIKNLKDSNNSLITGVFCFPINIDCINIIKKIYNDTLIDNNLKYNVCYHLLPNNYFSLIECYLANYDNNYYCDNIYNINIIYNRTKYSIVHFINDFNTKIFRMLNSYPEKIIKNFQHLLYE